MMNNTKIKNAAVSGNTRLANVLTGTTFSSSRKFIHSHLDFLTGGSAAMRQPVVAYI